MFRHSARDRSVSRRSVLNGIAVTGGLVLSSTAPPALAQGINRSLAWPLISPAQLRPNLVDVTAAEFKGRNAVALELTAEAQKALLVPGSSGNGPSFAMPEIDFANGTIEVDLAARINGKGQPDVRGFVGLAFHIGEDHSTFEAVYLRMTNGSRNTPPPPAPRNVFAVQYISYPDRYWRKLRQEQPNRYEKAAPVAIETWHKLRIEINGSVANVFVDEQAVMTVDDLRYPDRKGRVGLWVDDGTTGYFANLNLQAR